MEIFPLLSFLHIHNVTTEAAAVSSPFSEQLYLNQEARVTNTHTAELWNAEQEKEARPAFEM